MLTEKQKDTFLSTIEIKVNICGGNFENELEILLSNIKYDLKKDTEKLIRKEFNRP